MLDRDRIIGLLTELGSRLAAKGERADLFVVGGAAMALAYSTRRSTRDLDAVFEPKQAVSAAAKDVARAHDLPEGWLNDAVKGFLPGSDPNATTLFEQPGISVRIASPHYLFAMKAAAARIERDAEDLWSLYRICGSVESSAVLPSQPPHSLGVATITGIRLWKVLGALTPGDVAHPGTASAENAILAAPECSAPHTDRGELDPARWLLAVDG
ncbi:DUF6036 family nucleotidyltransferase [Mycobacterium sp.]|uniref:DUF6036 family nucleotidyltransferase n=1 Tax=Mycobacterium sp. TaxID=1785 RepID=UPI0031D2E94C